jgi:hypothetical protein
MMAASRPRRARGSIHNGPGDKEFREYNLYLKLIGWPGADMVESPGNDRWSTRFDRHYFAYIPGPKIQSEIETELYAVEAVALTG